MIFCWFYRFCSKRAKRYERVHLFCRSTYHQIGCGQLPANLSIYDLDAQIGKLNEICLNSDVLCFWKDPEWIKELGDYGTNRILTLNPRPSIGVHFTQNILDKLGWKLKTPNLKVSWLGDYWKSSNVTLWIHPGSGSRKKNRSLQFFEKRALEWLDKSSKNRVFFSFGEADAFLEKKFLESKVSGNDRVQGKSFVKLADFKDRLIRDTAYYLGNDSGPTHLAAMLGMPTEAHFICTNPEVWQPLGPRVKLFRFQQNFIGNGID